MSELQKPYPVPDGDSAPFWEGARQGHLRIQRCSQCDRYIFYPRAVCPHCMSASIEWVTASGRGSIHAFTVVHRAPEEFRREVPYVVALVDLEEGVRMMTRIVDCQPASVRVGLPVAVTFQALSEEIALPCFRPAPAGRPTVS
jgi:uncharacterized OB-fold protein